MNQIEYNYERVAKALDFISNNLKSQPSLEQIAEKVNLSPFHFQKLFTEWAGVSPKKFLQYLTLEYAKKLLIAENDITIANTIDELGLSSCSRLHDLFVKVEGMTPGEYKNGGENLVINYSLQKCLFGRYLLASTNKGVCNLYFYDKDEKIVIEEFKKIWSKAILNEGKDLFQEEVIKFLKNDLEDIPQIKLHLKGTEFQLKVWDALLKIPEGKLTSYSSIARKINLPSASRAVGTAIGCNNVAFIIPCHRVIKSLGEIGEFRWGSIRKKAIIGWEASKVNILQKEDEEFY